MISTTLVVIFVLTVLISFSSSLLEAVLLSVTPSHIEVMVKQGRPSGRLLRELKTRVDRPLIAILTLNTLVNMFGSAAIGAESAQLAEDAGADGGLWVAVGATAISFAILVFAEIIPKTLGAVFWKQLAGPSAPVIKLLVVVLTPAVLLLEFLPKLISKKGQASHITRDELAILTEMGSQTGAIPAQESRAIANLLRLNLMRVKDVMTPRVDVFALANTLTCAEAVSQHDPIRFSRIPVYDETIDRVTGIVMRVQLLDACLKGMGATRLEDLKLPMFIVPETKSVASMLEAFVKRHEHMALVVNEYGGTEGVITLEDVIETLLGVEIADEMDNIEKLRRLAIQRMEAQRRVAKKAGAGAATAAKGGARPANERPV